ncbi:MAG: MBL fold metallo-hydrolase [Gammaproteobacteria bacterium]|nr:MBL fold metallo-hydrolase [Gammaproteobacteria bacterium]
MSTPKLAASVIIAREQRDGMTVLLVRRAPEMRFFGGYWAFPGGNVAGADSSSPGEPENLVLQRCARRELAEETGLVADSLLPVCRMTTPPFYPVRYETQFYLSSAGPGAEPTLPGSELVEWGWFDAGDAVRAWERGEMEIAPPVLFLLRTLGQYGLRDLPARAAAMAATFESVGVHPACFSPGMFVAPLRTPTLPPATTTNTVIAGHRTLYVIDPATPEPAEQARLFHQMDLMLGDGAQFEAILLTHHHHDHVGAVNAVSRRFRLPVRAHALTFERVAGDYLRGEPLADGDRIPLGLAPDGTPAWHLDVVHTPGHAVDHLCFMDSRYHTAVVGDMLSTISTILIDPPEGHMRTYLDSLRRLLAMPIKTLIPAHGLAHRDGHALIREFLEHRRMREEQALAALKPEPATVESLVPLIYTTTPPGMFSYAARSLLAELIKLREEGRCEEAAGGWRLTSRVG